MLCIRSDQNFKRLGFFNFIFQWMDVLNPFFSSFSLWIRCQENISRLGQEGRNKSPGNPSVGKDEWGCNNQKKKKKISLFHLRKLYPLPIPFLPPTHLHNNLAIYQSLLGTVVIGAYMLVKIMGFGDRIYGFEFELCHLPTDVILSLSVLIF